MSTVQFQACPCDLMMSQVKRMAVKGCRAYSNLMTPLLSKLFCNSPQVHNVRQSQRCCEHENFSCLAHAWLECHDNPADRVAQQNLVFCHFEFSDQNGIYGQTVDAVH